MINIEDTILSQYANSPALLQLINSFNYAVDPYSVINTFYNNLWNINTAVGYGLDVWGRIVGVNRVLQVPSTAKTFGFDEATVISADPFGQSPFYTGSVLQNYSLPDSAFRTLILVKALANISSCSINTYNNILMQLFPGRGNDYVIDLGNMQMQLNFEFILQPFELSIIKQSGAFVAPTGVGYEVMQLNLPNVFGFAEAGVSASTMNNGTFFGGFS